MQTRSPSGQCTANFIFVDGAKVYIGHAAHCTSLGGATGTNGCENDSHPIGTSIDVRGPSEPGTLAYNSWLTMQEVNETDSNTCNHNDFALIELHPDDHDKVNPSLPVFGGPQGTNTDGTSFGNKVYTYGNSGLRAGITQLSPKEGYSVGRQGDG